MNGNTSHDQCRRGNNPVLMLGLQKPSASCGRLWRCRGSPTALAFVARLQWRPWAGDQGMAAGAWEGIAALVTLMAAASCREAPLHRACHSTRIPSQAQVRSATPAPITKAASSSSYSNNYGSFFQKDAEAC